MHPYETTLSTVLGRLACRRCDGGTIALVRDGDQFTVEAHQQLLQLDVPDEEIVRRRQIQSSPLAA